MTSTRTIYYYESTRTTCNTLWIRAWPSATRVWGESLLHVHVSYMTLTSDADGRQARTKDVEQRGITVEQSPAAREYYS